MFQMMGVFAEFERSMIRERVLAGMSRAAASGTRSGKPIGRPRIEPETEASIRAALEKGDMGMRKVCSTVRSGDRDGSAYCQGGGRVRRGLTAPRSGFEARRLPGIGRPVDWDDLIQPDSEQFRTVPRTQGAVAGTLDPSSGDAPRRTRGRRERDHDAPPFAKRPAVGSTGHRFPAKFLGCSGSDGHGALPLAATARRKHSRAYSIHSLSVAMAQPPNLPTDYPVQKITS
jgi:hypothetical protein